MTDIADIVYEEVEEASIKLRIPHITDIRKKSMTNRRKFDEFSAIRM
jgi:small-conductance mechanosensitive channel